jgi:hypothetical protein
MLQLLHVRFPEFSRALDILRLRLLVPAEQEQNDVATAPSKVQAIPRTEVQSGFRDSAADLLVIAEVANFESKDACLHASSGRRVQFFEPVSKGYPPAAIDVFADGEGSRFIDIT